MRTATEVGSSHHIFRLLFFGSHAGYCTLLNPCSATQVQEDTEFHISAGLTVRPDCVVSYVCLCQHGRKFSFLCLNNCWDSRFFLICTFFFAFTLGFLVFYPIAYLFHVAIIQKILLIVPHYPCFASCVVLYANSSFTYNEAALSNQVAWAFRESLAVFTRHKRYLIIIFTFWFHNSVHIHQCSM